MLTINKVEGVAGLARWLDSDEFGKEKIADTAKEILFGSLINYENETQDTTLKDCLIFGKMPLPSPA